MQFLLHPSSVGAVAPSSRYLAQAMVDAVDWSDCRSVVEYGPGTGVFTEQILKRRTPGTPVMIIERNENFCRQLEERFQGAEHFYLVQGSAENAADYLAERNLPIPDAILSGLPFASLPKEVSETILARTASLLAAEKPGIFVTFQYSLLKMTLLETHLRLAAHRRVWRNFPPAHVLTLTPKHQRSNP